MRVELIYITPNAEKRIENAGRTAYLSFDKAKEDSAEKFVRMLIRRKHYSVLEHATASFRISEVSRCCTHQIVRHRLASYTQQSQRVVEEENLMEYTIPPLIKEDPLTNIIFRDTMKKCFGAYKKLRKLGINKEDSRFVLPNACRSQLVMSGNFRTWRHIIKIRGSKHAQWEFRSVIKGIRDILVEKCPSAFDDLEVYEDDLR